jgi:hypothetical protein
VFLELPGVLESTMALCASEVGILWTGIQPFVHPDHWNPSKWSPESRITREYYDDLRKTSYALIARFADSMTKGGRLVTPLSVDSRASDFFNTSNFTSQFEWPQLPLEMPKTQAQWEARRTHYSVHMSHVGYEAFERKFCEIGNLPRTVESISDDEEVDGEESQEVSQPPPNSQPPEKATSPEPSTPVKAGAPQFEPQVQPQHDLESAKDVSSQQESLLGSQAAEGIPTTPMKSCSEGYIPLGEDTETPKGSLAHHSQYDGDTPEPESQRDDDEEGHEFDSDFEEDTEQTGWDLTDIGSSVPMDIGSEMNLVLEETFNRIQQLVEAQREEQRQIAYRMMIEEIDPAPLIFARSQALSTLGVHGFVAFTEELLDQSNARANELILAMNSLIANNNKERARLVQKAKDMHESLELLNHLKKNFRTSSTRLSDQRQSIIEDTPAPPARAPLFPQGASGINTSRKPRTAFGHLTAPQSRTKPPTIPQTSRRQTSSEQPKHKASSVSSSSASLPPTRTAEYRDPLHDRMMGQSSAEQPRHNASSALSSSASVPPTRTTEYRDPLHDRMMGRQT